MALIAQQDASTEPKSLNDYIIPFSSDVVRETSQEQDTSYEAVPSASTKVQTNPDKQKNKLIKALGGRVKHKSRKYTPEEVQYLKESGLWKGD